MSAAYGAHEVDDGHDHHAGGRDLHAERYRSAGHRAYNPGAGGDDHEQECAPGL